MKKMTSEQYRRKLAGAHAREAGLTFEEQIAASLEWYEERGIMKADKTPEPMKPIGKRQKGGRFLAIFTEKAQVDFSGTLKGGRSVRFEAKQTDTDRFDRSRLTKKQMDDLREHEKLGAACFVLLCFGSDRFYRVPWVLWDKMKESFGRQYVTEADLELFRVPSVAGIIKILEGMSEERGWQENNTTWTRTAPSVSKKIITAMPKALRAEMKRMEKYDKH